MCELFGVFSNVEVEISFSWRGFRKRGQYHPDGWGLAWYVDKGKAGVVKEPRSSENSNLAKTLRGLGSKIFIAHVRYASLGGLSYVNTHPFVRRLLGRDWVFAHNGTLHGIENELELKFLRPIGETNSEYVFCYLLERISEASAEEEIPERILEGAQEIAELGTFNFLLSNGKSLFAYTEPESGESMLK